MALFHDAAANPRPENIICTAAFSRITSHDVKLSCLSPALPCLTAITPRDKRVLEREIYKEKECGLSGDTDNVKL